MLLGNKSNQNLIAIAVFSGLLFLLNLGSAAAQSQIPTAPNELLHYACKSYEQNNEEYTKFERKFRYDIFVLSPIISFFKILGERQTIEKRIERIDAALARGANVNYQDKDGNTALIWAAKAGNISVMNHLFKKDGLNYCVKNKKGKTALTFLKQNLKKTTRSLKKLENKNRKIKGSKEQNHYVLDDIRTKKNLISAYTKNIEIIKEKCPEKQHKFW